jgi:hypothetical protein
VSRNIRDTKVFQAIDQIIWECPELENNVWLKHRREIIEMIEDEGVRTPPLSAIFEEEVIKVEESQDSLITLLLKRKKEASAHEE